MTASRDNDEARRLQAQRTRIDEIDDRIEALVNERVGIAQEIARIKASGPEAGYYRPEREAQVLRRIVEQNRGPLPDEAMARIFREIMSATLAAESRLEVAALGPEGTYTQAAALKHFGHAVRLLSTATIDDVFRAVEAERVQFGVVPVENSVEGGVTNTLDRLVETPLSICGEVQLRVHHCLLSRAEALASIERVLAHGQALAQCRRWLDATLPGVAVDAQSSNAEAARRARDDDTVAAIASRESADIYGLNVLAANIEDDPGNTTRFLVVGKHASGPSGNDKTSLLVSSRNVPGALYRLLEPLARHGISMTRIESRPSRTGLWEYVFFIDIDGHVQDERVATALAELEKEAAMLKVLGAYPRAVV